jgi:hypothetical protein
LTPPDAISLDGRPQRDPQVAFVVLDGETVLFHEGLGQAHLFNPTATLVWTELDGQREVSTLVDEFVTMTGAPAAVVERDVLSALEQFAALGLLEGIEPHVDRSADAETDRSAP